MITQSAVEKLLNSLPEVSKDYPYDEKIAVYSYKEIMFAFLEEGSRPIILTLRCDPKLAELLREKYETVMAAEKLDKRHWNRLVLSGQLPESELKDLIRHAWEIAKSLKK